MRLIFLCIILLSFSSTLEAQHRRVLTKEERRELAEKRLAARQKDSINRSQQKELTLSGFFKFDFINAYTPVRKRNDPLSFGLPIDYGYGGEMQFGIKVHKNVSIGAGLNVINFDVRREEMERNLLQSLADASHTSQVAVFDHSYFLKVSGFLYASYWQYRPKSVLEFYTKMAYCNTQLALQSSIFRREFNSKKSEYSKFSGYNTQEGFMPAMGGSYSLKLYRVLYFHLAGEYGYMINPEKRISKETRTSDNTIKREEVKISAPLHFLQLNAGLMIRLSNTIPPKDHQYEKVERKNQKNN